MVNRGTGSTAAVLLAAGRSERMLGEAGKAAGRKPFLPLRGRTVVEHACLAFDAARSVSEIVLVAHPEDVARLQALVRGSPDLRKVRRVVPGGELRTDSVRAGVAAADPALELVAVHDVARPLVETSLVEDAIAVAARHGAALVAVPVTDTIKTSSDGERSDATLDRGVLWSAQTPQVFRAALLRELLERARAEGFRPTDDAALHERYVGPVPIVRGSATNLKLTSREDLALAEAVLRAREGVPR